MIRIIVICAAVILGGCQGIMEKRDTFISECIGAGNKYIDCLYSEYNNSVYLTNVSIKERHEEGAISDAEKASYKERIIELNERVDTAYAIKDVDSISNSRSILRGLEQILRERKK
jgi:hypothetical protein